MGRSMILTKDQATAIVKVASALSNDDSEAKLKWGAAVVNIQRKRAILVQNYETKKSEHYPNLAVFCMKYEKAV